MWMYLPTIPYAARFTTLQRGLTVRCEQQNVDRRVAIEPLHDVEPPGGLHGSVDAQEGDPAARTQGKHSNALLEV